MKLFSYVWYHILLACSIERSMHASDLLNMINNVSVIQDRSKTDGMV